MTIDKDNQTNALIIATAKGNTPLQVVRWSGARQAVVSSASSKVIPLPAGLEGMEISAVEDVYVNFGSDDTVVASSTIASDGSRLFLKGVQVVPVPIDPATAAPYTFMAVIRKSTDGIFQVESGSVNVPFPALPAPPSDPDFTSVVLLLDWAGVDGGTDTTDLSNSAHVDTFEGNAQIDTAIQSPEGTNSALFDGVDDAVSFPDSDDWDFGTDDFTVEVSVRFASLTGTQTIFGHSGGGADAGFILRFVNPNIVWIIGGATIAIRSLAPLVNTYHHIAVCRSGTDFRVFFDGVQSGATVTDSTAIGPTVRDLDLGALVGTAQELNGLIGAVRITKGVARYTANFTPPTTMYPTSA